MIGYAGRVATPVRDAVDALAQTLPRAAALTATPDVITPAVISSGGQAESEPPWNAQAAYVVTDVAAGARDLEARLYTAVTGQRRAARGGSDGNTGAAIEQIARLAAALPGHQPCPHTPRCRRCCCETCCAAARVGAWVVSAKLLPAIDEAARWIPIPGDPPCPYCSTPSLRYAQRQLIVACHNPDCADSDGNTPAAHCGYSPRDAAPALMWRDGLVTGAA